MVKAEIPLFFMLYRCFIGMVFCVLSIDAQAQAVEKKDGNHLESVSYRSFDTVRWRELKKDMDFSPRAKKEKKKETDLNSGGSLSNYDAIFLFAALVLLIFLIFHFAGGVRLFQGSNKSVPVRDFSIRDIEDNLPAADLEDPIRQAIRKEDFALAVRLYYLAVLKELALRKRIHWKKDKTNGEYLQELAQSPFFYPFKNATIIFERIWYGKSVLTYKDFLPIQQDFSRLVEEIKKLPA